MTNDELTDLRRWAAEVCGYERNQLNANTAARYFKAGRELFVTAWLPDQNIAQAFEVLDAVRERLGQPSYEVSATSYEVPCVGPHRCWVGYSMNGIESFHENRCLAILLACKAATEAK